LSDAAPGLVAIYLHGSACLGGWHPGRSDVDLLIVVEDDVSDAMLEPTIDVLVREADGYPGKGIECSVVSRRAISAIRDRWPFLAHISTETDGIRKGFPVSPDASDPDLLMHYAVCRAAGIAVFGPAPEKLIAPVDREVVLAYLADEMEWGLANGSSSYALLNACRALEYLDHGRIVSKVEGGQSALQWEDAPVGEIRQALAAQQGDAEALPLTAAGEAFVRNVANRLREAATRER
jgi:streptomycin 3"-adenylyltransferase